MMNFGQQFSRNKLERALVIGWGGADTDDLCDSVQEETFKPDLQILFNPPYEDFCPGLLIRYVASRSLALRRNERTGTNTLTQRYPVTRHTIAATEKGIAELAEHGELDDSGRGIIHLAHYHTHDDLNFTYTRLMFDKCSGSTGLELVLNVKGMDGVLKREIEFGSLNDALLHLIGAQYFSPKKFLTLLQLTSHWNIFTSNSA